MGEFAGELNALRQKLLDLTLNNRLLNYRPAKRRSIEIVDELPAEIFDLLVLNERTMYFKAEELKSSAESTVEDEDEPAEIWEPPTGDGEVADRYRDKYLQTTLGKGALQKSLFMIQKEADSILEERGYTALFLALGFLEWRDKTSADVPRFAPIVLIPVDLARTSVGSPFRLKWSGEDLVENISLRARLRDENIELPEFAIPEDKEALDAYLQQVAECIKGRNEWAVRPNISLGFFSFTKFVMFNDLSPEVWPQEYSPGDNPILGALFDGDSEPDTDSTPKTFCRSIDQFHVVDADPSQSNVIEAVKSGHNLLVEGPPGTGKSQTILNLIAELLAQNRSILFVSEKMAALQVVKSRLDQIGLGQFCLELHSRNSTRRQVLQQLEETMRMEPPRQAVMGDEYARHDELQNTLDSYAAAVHEPFGQIRMSPHELLGKTERALQHFNSKGCRMPNVTFLRPDHAQKDQIDAACEAIEELATVFDLVRPVIKHPWNGCNPVQMFDDDIDELRQQLLHCIDAIDGLKKEAERAAGALKSRPVLSLDNVKALMLGLDLIFEHEPVSLELLTETTWDRENSAAEKLVKQLESYHRQREKCLKLFTEEGLMADAKELTKRNDKVGSKLYRFLLPSYYSLRGELSKLYRDAPPRDWARVKSDLAQVGAAQDCRKKVTLLADDATSYFGDLWQGPDQSDFEALQALGSWIMEVREAVKREIFSDDTLEMMSQGMDKEVLDKNRDDLDEAVCDVDEKISKLLRILRPDDELAFGARLHTCSLDDLKQAMEEWERSLDKLPRWHQYTERLTAVRKSVAGSMVGVLQERDIMGEDLPHIFNGRFYGQMLKSAVKRRSALQEFVGELHEDKIAKFRRLDRQVIALNRCRLIDKLYARLPKLGKASPNSQLGVLNSEFNRKRGHMAIRKLLQNCGQLIQDVKPCFMMSPMSVAQFLQPGEMEFDVVVFDEASQVRPEEAVGACMRGRQLVVMGDTRQLPPTSFFERLSSGEDLGFGEDSPATVDMESLLDICRGRIQERPLSWHYRSRHESLIAVANRASYGNRLLVFPSPFNRHDYFGLFHHYTAGTTYDRGRSRMNRGEARAVAETVVKLHREHPGKSIGVGTFNAAQQLAIQEEIELQLRGDPSLEDVLRDNREPFFVKNLETIQGDERDIILISCGYGFDKDGKLSLNFGPLNQTGGERRLNVLITRARERCMVFSNFRASDLTVDVDDDNAALGVRHLKTYLEYAETGNLTQADEDDDNAVEPFENVVHEFLVDQGYKVRPGVGCARYRLDVAVIDPEDPNRYVIGIQSDGAMYHHTSTARERDRLRQQVLESMGWKLHRVWSTDWFRSHKQTQRRLTKAIEEASTESFGTKSSEALPDVRFTDKAKPIESVFESLISDYEMCSDLGMETEGKLEEASPAELVQAVLMVLRTEAPIHLDDLVQRICSFWKKKQSARAGNAIKEAVDQARTEGMVNVSDGFVLLEGERTTTARRRKGTVDFSRIQPQEIAIGVKAVLLRQYATPARELSKEVCRIFGAKRVTDEAASLVNTVIDEMTEDRALTLINHGRIWFNSGYEEDLEDDDETKEMPAVVPEKTQVADRPEDSA